MDQQLSLTDADVALEVLQRYPLTAAPAIAQLQGAMVYRAIQSQAQLFEVMVDFRNDHFNTYIYKNPIDISCDA